MHPKLAQLFAKRKVEVKDLEPEEKELYDSWDKVLSENITIETISDFCKAQKKEIESKYTDFDNSRDKDFILKATLLVYTNILGIIEGEEAEKIALIQQLEQLIQK